MHKSTLNIWIFYFYKIVSFIATAVMALEWPEYMQMTSPADMSHSLAVLSDDPVRMKEESAENAASQIQLVWPESVEDKLIDLDCLSIDQVLIKPSDPMVTSTLKNDTPKVFDDVTVNLGKRNIWWGTVYEQI